LGTSYAELDTLETGDIVMMFARVGK
jgi:hypothetical protein